MKLGFMVVKDMRALPFEKVVSWGATNGFYAIDAPFEQIDLCKQYGVAVGSIMLTPNVITQDDAARQAAQTQCQAIITDMAAKGVRRAMIQHTRTPGLNLEDSIALWVKGYGPVAEVAEQHNVKLVMEIYHNHGQWLAITPERIRALFKALPSRAVGICLDPSHLVVQGIDYMRATYEFGERIYYAHAKDAEILKDKLYEYGVLGKGLGNPHDRPMVGWWRYRLPGYGQIQWPQFLSALKEVGYDDVIAVEHEDGLYYGNVELNQQGLLLSKQFLAPYLV